MKELYPACAAICTRMDAGSYAERGFCVCYATTSERKICQAKGSCQHALENADAVCESGAAAPRVEPSRWPQYVTDKGKKRALRLACVMSRAASFQPFPGMYDSDASRHAHASSPYSTDACRSRHNSRRHKHIGAYLSSIDII
eukprot:4225443-Pleurochrysis_carterae.AAC.6